MHTPCQGACPDSLTPCAGGSACVDTATDLQYYDCAGDCLHVFQPCNGAWSRDTCGGNHVYKIHNEIRLSPVAGSCHLTTWPCGGECVDLANTTVAACGDTCQSVELPCGDTCTQVEGGTVTLFQITSDDNVQGYILCNGTCQVDTGDTWLCDDTCISSGELCHDTCPPGAVTTHYTSSTLGTVAEACHGAASRCPDDPELNITRQCATDADCQAAASCVLDPAAGRFYCQCGLGYRLEHQYEWTHNLSSVSAN